MDQDGYWAHAHRQLAAWLPTPDAVWSESENRRALAHYNADPAGYAVLPLEIAWGTPGPRRTIRFTLPAADDRPTAPPDTAGLRGFARRFMGLHSAEEPIVQRRARLVRYLSRGRTRAVEFHFMVMRADTFDPDDAIVTD